MPQAGCEIRTVNPSDRVGVTGYNPTTPTELPPGLNTGIWSFEARLWCDTAPLCDVSGAAAELYLIDPSTQAEARVSIILGSDQSGLTVELAHSIPEIGQDV